MSRRASSSINPLWIVIILSLLTIAIAGGYLLRGRASNPYRTIETLDVTAYLENSNSLRGNAYKMTGTILNELGWTKTARLYSIEVSSDSHKEVLPILIPTQLRQGNIERGQRFFLKVEVDEKGILKVNSLQKV